MIDIYTLYQRPLWVIIIFASLILWDTIWRGFALWTAAKYQQKGWFIALLLINSIGILPIIYLLAFKPKRKSQNIVLTKSVKNGKKKR